MQFCLISCQTLRIPSTGGVFTDASRKDRTESVVLGDVDGDGDLDLVCGNSGMGYTYQSNTLYLNTGGAFET